jgi:hypothetical protein
MTVIVDWQLQRAHKKTSSFFRATRAKHVHSNFFYFWLKCVAVAETVHVIISIWTDLQLDLLFQTNLPTNKTVQAKNKLWIIYFSCVFICTVLFMNALVLCFSYVAMLWYRICNLIVDMPKILDLCVSVNEFPIIC